MTPHLRWGLLSLFLGFSAAAEAPADVRVALVIGNAAYAGAPLANPTNDARAMSTALKELGFSVVEVHDAKKAEMEAAIVRAAEAIKASRSRGVGMLYYAGHGLQVDWRNYMVPVDARLASAADVRRQAVDVQQVVDAFKSAGNRMNIVVLDACRDNPFGDSASGKGLAQMDAPPGTFLAFATAPGNVAEDGDAKSGNGLYTQYLVKEIQQPSARIEDVFKRVRFQVRRHSEGRQIPWESTSLEDDFSFDPKASAREGGRLQLGFEAEKSDWDRIAKSSQVGDFYEFLKKYPNGHLSELAASRVERLQQARIEAQPDRDGKRASDLQWLHRDGDRYEFVVKDGYTGVVRTRGTAEVRFIGEDVFEGRGGRGIGAARATRDGFMLSDYRGTFDPPWPIVPTGMFQVGRRTHGRTILTQTDGRKMWMDFDTRVMGRERLQTAFGELDTFRVDTVHAYESGERHEWTFWYEPGWGYAVRLRQKNFKGSGPPDFFEREMVARIRKS